MTPVTITNVDELRRLVGTPIGPSGWREVTQQAVDDFSRISGDGQWIHTDPDSAHRASPFGGPVAHGNLTLAMIDGFREQLVDWSGFQLDINYGFNKVRFPAPVPVGSKLRATLEVTGIKKGSPIRVCRGLSVSRDRVCVAVRSQGVRRLQRHRRSGRC